MFEVYWMTWEGREEEPEAVFNTFEEAEEYIEVEMEKMCSPEEGYVIRDVEANQWY